ncbi:MAG: APC family permease [bacterium]
MPTKHQFTEQELFSEETELNRRLGITEAFSIIISRIIGSGIFRTPAPIMLLVASVSLYYGVWILGGIATLLGAVLYAELVAMMPKSGGPYAYLKAAYPPIVAFLRGWAMFFVSETAAIAAVALVFAEYGNEFYASLTGGYYPHLVEIVIALVVIWGHSASHCFGVVLSGVIQNVFGFLKLVAIGAIISVCFSKGGDIANFSTPFWPEEFNWSTMLAFGAAMRYGFFAYSGWEGSTYVAEEIRNPRRNLPLALFLGISGVMLLYLAANSAYLYQLSVPEIQGSPWVATAAMNKAIGLAGGTLISVAVMLNTFGNVSTQILCKSRTWYAMAHDGLFIRQLERIHPKYKTPNVAILVQAFWASVLLMGSGFAESAYEALIDFFSFTSTIFNILTFASIWALRRKFPNALRPYRAWGYPVSLILILLIYAWFMMVTLITAFIPSLLGALLTSTGLLYYYREEIREWLRKRGLGV